MKSTQTTKTIQTSTTISTMTKPMISKTMRTTTMTTMIPTSIDVPKNAVGGPSWYGADGNPTKAPFPYPGGKSRTASLVWERFGNVDNYLESFHGSGANLLMRPADHFANGYRTETVNDINHFIVNYLRAVQAAPDEVAAFADWPVTEADLHARHLWLMRSDASLEFRELMSRDPLAYDARIAGWWLWGACCWIGGAWCTEERTEYKQSPYIDTGNGGGRGVHAKHHDTADVKQIPEIGDHFGRGVLNSHGRPQLADAYDIGRGVNSGGNVADRRAWLVAWMRRLSDRYRMVRVLYGDWRRIGDSPSTLTRLGTTGIFLDPPYPIKRVSTGEKSRSNRLYASDNNADLETLRDDCFDYCRKYGRDPQIRIALCCYEDDGYEPLAAEGWEVVEWVTNGGYANQSGKKTANAKRERIYFSPACLKPANLTPSLF